LDVRRATNPDPNTVQPLPSVQDIANIIQFASDKDAILIAQTETLCLDDLSLEGDIADDVSL
jgi:hypothetical protein